MMEALVLLGGYLCFVRFGYYAISKLDVFLDYIRINSEVKRNRNHSASAALVRRLLPRRWGQRGRSML